jgi:hypothetical protein
MIPDLGVLLWSQEYEIQDYEQWEKWVRFCDDMWYEKDEIGVDFIRVDDHYYHLLDNPNPGW